MNKSTVFEYKPDFQGQAIVGGATYPVVIANGIGYIHPKNDAQRDELRSKGLKEIDVELVGLTATEKIQRTAILDKLKGINLTEEQVEKIQALPPDAQKQIAENIDSIINSVQTKNPEVKIPEITELPPGLNKNVEGTPESLKQTTLAAPPFDEINVKELTAVLEAKGVEIPKNAKKQDLYDLAYPKV